jgi:hypothetical protein
MARVLCIIGLILSGLTALLFLLDLILAKPFGGHNMVMDIVFLVCSLVVAALSFQTLRAV